MLSSMNASMSKGPTKIVMAVLMFLLSASFALWGIEDVFRGRTSTDVATVGDTPISMQAYMEAYRQRANAITRATGKPVTPDMARAFGLDRQVLYALVADAALDTQAHKYGLGLNSEQLLQSVMTDPNFMVSIAPGQPPVFDISSFRQMLQQTGLSEQAFFASQRQVYLRGQLDKAFAEGGRVPTALQQAVARYIQEKRSVSYFILPQSSVGDIPAPTAAELQSFYEENKASFRTLEYRSATYLLIGPAELAARANITDADIQDIYNKRKASYGTPEKRTVEQLSFPSLDEAKAASARLASGQITFEALVAERKLKPEDVNLGTLTRAQLNDPKIAEAAFSLKEGAVSEPVQGTLTNVILKIAKIEPATIATLDSVKDEIRQSLIAQRSSEILKDLRDTIDDQRMGGTPLAEIATKLNLKAASLPPVNRDGRDQAGNPAELPLAQLLPALFSAEPGADPEVVDGREAGLLWFSVDKVIAAHDRTLDEARTDAVAAWTAEQRVHRLKSKAEDLVKQLADGKSFEDMAKSLNRQALPAWNLTRTGENQALPPAVVNLIFATPLKGFGSAVAPNGTDRIVFHVEDSVVPEFDAKSPQSAAMAGQLSQAIGQDLLGAYVKKAQDDQGVSINQINIDRVVGGGSAL